jgi:hypothetical protein
MCFKGSVFVMLAVPSQKQWSALGRCAPVISWRTPVLRFIRSECVNECEASENVETRLVTRAGLLVHTFQYGQMRCHFRSVLSARNARNRSSVASRSIDVKRRLVEIWHQSLAQSEKSRSWTGFSKLKRGVNKKAAYTAATHH